jgi:hypothetical protein
MIARHAALSVASLAAAVAMTVPFPARADPAVAESLFREGRRLLDEGKVDEACAKLAESEAQDPSSGTLLNLGLCHEMQHKIATAWSDYVSARRLAREQHRPDRAEVAEKKAADLEPRLPHLTVTAIAPVAGLEILLGTDRLGVGMLGSNVPVDPGSYEVTASAPGRRAWKTKIDLAEAESKTVQVPELESETPVPEAVVPPPEPPPVVPVRPHVAPPAEGAPPSRNSFPLLGWIIGGTGVAALAVGGGFGVASLASYHDASTACPTHKDCGAAAMSARNSAEVSAWVSNVAIGLGIVGVGVGTWIIVLSARGREPATRISIRVAPGLGTSVSLEQSF